MKVTAYLRVDGVPLTRELPVAFAAARPGDMFEVEHGGWTVEISEVQWGVAPHPHCSIVLPDQTSGADGTQADRDETAEAMRLAGWKT